MSHRLFFSRVLFCISILLGSMAPVLGMDVPRPSVNVKNDNNAYRSDSVSVFGMEELSNPQFMQRSVSSTGFDGSDNDSQSEDNEALGFGELNDKFDETLFTESYARVPVDIDRMVRRSLDPNAPKLMAKIISLVGPTGSGKSISARAIAWKMKRNYIFVSSLDLLGSVLHKGTENVKALFKGMRKFKILPALILDEANFLGDDYIKGNSDAKFTVSQLWSKCDALADRDDFLLIMTGNDFKNLPHPLQDRIMMHLYELPYLPFAPERLKTLVEKNNGYSLVASEASLNEFTQKIQPFSTRVINDMVDYAIGLAWDRKDKQVTAQDLNTACDRAIFNRQRYCDFTPHEVPEERRHRESLTQNRELSNQSRDLSVTHHDASIGQSAAHHRASMRQSYRHHEESHAQSLASHAQTAQHHRASQQQAVAHHNASLQQSGDHHYASQRVTLALHNDTQNQSADQHAASQRLTVAQHDASQQLTREQHAAAQVLQELLFVQGTRVQAHLNINNFSASAGAGVGGGGAGVNGSVSVGNIGKKEHLFNSTFTARQLAINARLNRESEGRITSMVGEVGAAVPKVKAVVGAVAAVAFGLQ